MARIKTGVTAHQRHKKVLSLTKGHRGTNRRLYKRASESMMHSLRYSTEHRRDLKGDMRRLWIVRINAAARANGLSYSQLIDGLNKINIAINRKMLADLAVRDPEAFASLVKQAQAE